MKINFKAIWKGLMRHSLSIIGGALVLFGVIDQSQSVEIMGYITSAIALGQSVYSSTKEEFSQKVQGVVRHILTFLGGLGVVKGWFTSEMFIEISSAIAAAAGLIWSIIANSKAPEVAPTPVPFPTDEEDI